MATLDLSYPAVLDLFRHHIARGRQESASFLMWYLENYFRLDPGEAVDSVCDNRGDKGVDGIYLSENDSTIYVFQSRLLQRPNGCTGDAPLKEFLGTLRQFENKEAIDDLVISAGSADVARLITKLDLSSKVADYDVRGIWVTNVDADPNARAFLRLTPTIAFHGKTELIKNYIPDTPAPEIVNSATFDITGFACSRYVVDKGVRAVIAPVKAADLVRLQGIADQTLFARNVRGSLGRTQVNKDIVRSIRSREKHKLFPLFHNGITIICGELVDTENAIVIDKYHVVNGCQSLTSLYENQESITEELRVLTKFIQVDLGSEISQMITQFSNNQNGVKARDFKSNHPTQVRLQREFAEHYASAYSFEIKRGEAEGDHEVISNEDAGLYLMAFDEKEPWGTHRKYQVFEERYAALFCRPEVTADRIVMCHEMMKVIKRSTEQINNQLFGKYAITRYVLLFVARCILENDDEGCALIQNPRPFVRCSNDRRHFVSCFTRLVDDMIIDVNGEVDECGKDFDYRDKLRDETWVRDLAKEVESDYLKMVRRGRVKAFSEEWRGPRSA